MNWFDSHCHLNSFLKKGTLDHVLTNADNENVSKLTTVGTSQIDWPVYQELSKKFRKKIFYSVGLHPCYVDEKFEEEVSLLNDFLISKYKPVAVGEIGLDYYHLPKNETQACELIEFQKIAFSQQIYIAKEYSLPVIIHSRGAFNDTLNILDKADVDWKKVIFHCFSESKIEMRQLNERGGRGSFTGILTYKKNDYLREAIIHQGIENIILETDCPYLSPETKRGLENEPGNLHIIGDYLARFIGCELEKIAEWSYVNATNFYDI